MGRMLSRGALHRMYNTISIALFSNDKLFGQFGVNKNHGARPTFIVIIFYCGTFPSHLFWNSSFDQNDSCNVQSMIKK